MDSGITEVVARSSARETASRVVGGAMAKLILQSLGIKVQAYVSQIGDIKVKKDYQSLNLDLTEKSACSMSG